MDLNATALVLALSRRALWLVAGLLLLLRPTRLLGWTPGRAPLGGPPVLLGLALLAGAALVAYAVASSARLLSRRNPHGSFLRTVLLLWAWAVALWIWPGPATGPVPALLLVPGALGVAAALSLARQVRWGRAVEAPHPT